MHIRLKRYGLRHVSDPISAANCQDLYNTLRIIGEYCPSQMSIKFRITARNWMSIAGREYARNVDFSNS